MFPWTEIFTLCINSELVLFFLEIETLGLEPRRSGRRNEGFFVIKHII